jgi:hypothetical protein
MEMALLKGIPTLLNSHGNWTRPDNVFVSSELNRVIECDVQENAMPKADHSPIITRIDADWKEEPKQLKLGRIRQKAEGGTQQNSATQ